MNREDKTLQEMLIGILAYGIIAQIICFVIWGWDPTIVIGLWTGVLTAAGMAIHMKRSIEDSLELGEAGATKHMRKTYAARYFVVLVVFAAVIYLEIGNGLAILAGVMSLKISAYLQPIVHKIRIKNTK